MNIRRERLHQCCLLPQATGGNNSYSERLKLDTKECCWNTRLELSVRRKVDENYHKSFQCLNIFIHFFKGLADYAPREEQKFESAFLSSAQARFLSSTFVARFLRRVIKTSTICISLRSIAKNDPQRRLLIGIPTQKPGRTLGRTQWNEKTEKNK